MSRQASNSIIEIRLNSTGHTGGSNSPQFLPLPAAHPRPLEVVMAALFLSLHLLRLFLSQLRRSASLGYVDTAPPEHLLHLWRVDYARLGREAKHAHQPIACPLRLRYPVKAIAPTKDLQGARSEGSCGNWGRTRAAMRGRTELTMGSHCRRHQRLCQFAVA